jgi:hypothetical protein
MPAISSYRKTLLNSQLERKLDIGLETLRYDSTKIPDYSRIFTEAVEI